MPTPLQTVVLTAPATIAGRAYKMGDEVAVSAATADWLVRHDTATLTADKPAKEGKKDKN